jgi:DNA-directed RNA polymerase specialized sigma24 family protein
MLSSASEAEDAVQEALLRVHQALDAGERIASPRAFVATVTTRLTINELRSARARRDRCVGEWLPAPIITDSHDDPAPGAWGPYHYLPRSRSRREQAFRTIRRCSLCSG